MLIYNYYDIINIENYKKVKLYKCKCKKCGYIKYIASQNVDIFEHIRCNKCHNLENKNTYVDKIIHKLKVIQYSHTDNKIKYYVCECECGSKLLIRAFHLYGSIKSCGQCIYIIDLTGRRFNRLTVIERYMGDYTDKIRWTCICDCGKIINARSTALLEGSVNSCGCYQKDQQYNSVITHELSKTRIYGIYHNMKQRCYNPNVPNYSNYGGKGIKMDDNWYDNFINFYNDMGESYERHVLVYGERNTTLDRIDGNKNYCKENCQWATYDEQARNKSNVKLYEIDGMNLCLKDIAYIYGVNYNTLASGINRGYPLERYTSGKKKNVIKFV